MDKKHIMFACKGNVGRSPVAELVANQYLQEVGADRDYSVSSSGTITHVYFQGQIPHKDMEQSIVLFTATGMYDPCFDHYLKAVDRGNPAEIQQRAREVAKACAQFEMNQRDKFLQEYGIKGTPKRNPEQLTARNDIDYLFAIARGVYDDIVRTPDGIYNGRQKPSVIEVLSTFATGNSNEPDSTVKLDDPSRVWDSYRESVYRILQHTPLALKRIIGA